MRAAFVSTELAEFIETHSRLPRLGEHPAPYTYRGWMLPYLQMLHQIHPTFPDRWGYHLRTIQAGRLLPEPIPLVSFDSKPHRETFKHLIRALELISTRFTAWSAFRELLSWLAWGVNVSPEPSKLEDETQSALYQHLDLGLFLSHPHDYLGTLLCEYRGTGWNPTAFFPTPHEVCELMVQFTLGGHSDPMILRSKTFHDPAVGSGRMLLHASNYSLRLSGQDIDPLAVQMTLIQGSWYAPWISFPLPDSIFETTDSSQASEPNAPPPTPLLS